ncbi:MAG: MAPEG family protein [Bdellovibrio sp.]
MAISIHLVYPMFAMFLLTVITLIKMFIARRNALTAGNIKLSYFKTFTGGDQPEEVLKTGRHFTNLFEAPVLFYIVCILGMIIPLSDSYFVLLAWLYVAARCLHAFIHMGNNKVMPRLKAYALSWLILAIMWVCIFIKAISISNAT